MKTRYDTKIDLMEPVRGLMALHLRGIETETIDSLYTGIGARMHYSDPVKSLVTAPQSFLF